MENSTERFNLVFRQYPDKVVVSKSRAATYWAPSDKLPAYIEEMLKSKQLNWQMRKDAKLKNIGYALYNEQERCFVVKNKESVGTAKSEKINGQRLWMGGNVQWYNAAVKRTLALYYVPRISTQWNISKLFAPKDHYIHFEYIFYYPFKASNIQAQDYWNHSVYYMKIFEDVLQEMKILDNDDPDHLRGGYARYVEIDQAEERRLEIKVHFCRNSERLH